MTETDGTHLAEPPRPATAGVAAGAHGPVEEDLERGHDGLPAHEDTAPPAGDS